jgi:hypothetical protein
MKILLITIFSLLFSYAFSQSLTNIKGIIVNENHKPVARATICYGNLSADTTYTDKQGRFKISYSNSKAIRYYLYIEKTDFLPKMIFVDITSGDTALTKAIVIRTRKGFWYDSKQIDSTHLGITVKNAIKKYKLDTTQCFFYIELIGTYNGFRTEFVKPGKTDPFRPFQIDPLKTDLKNRLAGTS